MSYFFWRKGGTFLFYLLFVIAAPIHLSLHPSFVGILEFLLVWVIVEILSKKKKRDFNSDLNNLTYSYVKSLGHEYLVGYRESCIRLLKLGEDADKFQFQVTADNHLALNPSHHLLFDMDTPPSAEHVTNIIAKSI